VSFHPYPLGHSPLQNGPVPNHLHSAGCLASSGVTDCDGDGDGEGGGEGGGEGDGDGD
jgi:hypothetical protein